MAWPSRTLLAARVVAIAALVTATACGPKPAARRPPPPPLEATAYAHYLRGRLAILEGDYDRAATELRAAAAAAPDEAMIALALIDATYRTGAKARARDEIVDATARWPRHPEVWLLAGRIHGGLRDHAAARTAYERAIHLDRAHEAAWLGLASTWIALKRPDRAEYAYRELLKAVPDSVDGRFLLATALIDRGREAAATPELLKVLELDPDHIQARLALAHALRHDGKLAEAVLQTRQAFDRTGGDLGVAQELFWLLCEADDRQGALDLLGLLDDPTADELQRLGVAHLYRAIGALDDAIRVADAARDAFPASAAARLVAAQARADRADAAAKDRARAVELALEVPEDDALRPDAVALTAATLTAAGEPGRARQLVDAARAARPDAIDLLVADADLLLAEGKPAAGRALLERAARKRQGSLELRYAWASFEDRAGEHARAAELAEQVLAARPDHVGALNLAGYALTRTGVAADLDRAERHLARARDLAPGDPSILDSWGWLLFQRGRLDEARAALAHALRFAPHLAEIRDHLSQVERRQRRAGG